MKETSRRWWKPFGRSGTQGELNIWGEIIGPGVSPWARLPVRLYGRAGVASALERSAKFKLAEETKGRIIQCRNKTGPRVRPWDCIIGNP